MSDRKLYVWWLTGSQCQNIYDRYNARSSDRAKAFPFPEYISSQVASLSGRNPRGRLWIPKEIDLGELPDIEKWTPKTRSFVSDKGGIVFFADDIADLNNQPGTITDLYVQPVSRNDGSKPQPGLA